MLHAMLLHIQTLLAQRERGQGMVEYALILALVSIAAIAVLVLLGPAIASILTVVTNAL
jgi:pilus assembly protein Flp/PilA